MDERKARRVLTELAKRKAQTEKVDFAALAFGPQRAFIEDPARLICAVTSRRAGKTDGMALKALRVAAEYPGSIIPYITLSRPQAKRNFWPKLQRWNRKLELGGKFNHTELSLTLPNGCRIELGGANDEAEIERWRGTDCPLAILDEAQSFRKFLKYLIEDILSPTTWQYGGQVVMTGTPNPGAIGYFHDASTGKLVDEDGQIIWTTHHWNAYSNPHLAYTDKATGQLVTQHEAVQRWRKQLGLREDSPKFLREGLGLWVRDSEGLVFPIPERAIIPNLPDIFREEGWSFVLGVDVGYADATAFVVLAYSALRGQIIVVESYQRTEMIPSAVAVEVDKLNSRYGFEAIAIDPGGGGKAYGEEMKQRFALPVEVAQKRDKYAAIQMLNGDMRTGQMVVYGKRNEELLEDCALLQWDYERLDREAHGGLVSFDDLQIDDRTPDHLTDAMLYGYRKCRAYIGGDDPTRFVKPGSTEAVLAEEKAMVDRARRSAAKGTLSGEWWEKGY